MSFNYLGEHKPGRIKPGRIKRAALSLQHRNGHTFDVCRVRHPGTKQLPIHISGAGFEANLQIWFLGTTPFDTTPFVCLRDALRADLPKGSLLQRSVFSQTPVVITTMIMMITLLCDLVWVVSTVINYHCFRCLDRKGLFFTDTGTRPSSPSTRATCTWCHTATRNGHCYQHYRYHCQSVFVGKLSMGNSPWTLENSLSEFLGKLPRDLGLLPLENGEYAWVKPPAMRIINSCIDRRRHVRLCVCVSSAAPNFGCV